MKIDFSNLKNNSKLMEFNITPGNKYYENIFLDTKNSLVYIPRMSFVIEIPIIIEKEDDESDLKFFINALNFSKLIQKYPELYLNSDKVFSPTDTFKNKYLIENIDEDFSPPNFNIDISNLDDSWIINELNFSENMLSLHINQGLNFINNMFLEHFGLFFRDGYLVATNKRQLYKSYIDSSILDCDFNFNSIKLINLLNSSRILVCINKNTGETYIESDNVKIKLASDYNLSIPNVNDPQFIANNNHANILAINKNEFEDIFSNIYSFLPKNLNFRFYIELHKENDEYLISFNSIDENKITEICKVDIDNSVNLDNLLNNKFWYDGSLFRTTLRSISLGSDEDTLLIQIDPSSPITNFKMKDNDNFNIIQVLLQEN